MTGIDNRLITGRVLLFLVGLEITLFHEVHAFPSKDRNANLAASDMPSPLLHQSLQTQRLKKRALECPPGLWCKRTSEEMAEKDEAIDDVLEKVEKRLGIRQEEMERQRGLKKSEKKREVVSCLPGRDCEKERETSAGTRLISRACPFGLWCESHEQKHNSEVQHDDSYQKEGEFPEKKNLPSEISTEPKSEDESAAEKDCPPGLWCKKSQQVIQSEDDRQQEDVPPERGCPFGLWCSQERSLGLQDASVISDCPPGLWCKRSQQAIQSEDDRQQEDVPPELRGCPFGLWCSQERSLGLQDSSVISDCPPGLWCKRSQQVIQSEEDRQQADVPPERGCPFGLWCSQKHSLDLQDSSVISDCPPGLWCKRETRPESKKTICPSSANSPWCKARADIMATEEKEREAERDCPPGLWCKRQTNWRENQPDQKCPPGIWCYGVNENGERAED